MEGILSKPSFAQKSPKTAANPEGKLKTNSTLKTVSKITVTPGKIQTIDQICTHFFLKRQIDWRVNLVQAIKLKTNLRFKEWISQNNLAN